MRLKAALQDMMTCHALRLLAICLPWPVFFPLAKWLSRFEWLFRNETEAAWRVASQVLGAVDERGWKARCRLTRVVDHVDAFIAARASDSWVGRNVVVTGEWPDQACVAVTFHFGTGVWALRHMRSSGRRNAFLSATVTKEAHAQRPCGYQVELAHLKAVETIGGAPIVWVGGSIAKMRKLLREGISIVGLIDVPGVHAKHGSTVRFLGHTARFPTGLLFLAETEQVPLAVFTCKLDYASGKRMLNIHAFDRASPDRMQNVADVLETAIRQESAAWHFWPVLQELVESPPHPLAASS